MKTSILLITTFVTSFWVSGQSIFEQYADNDEVTLVSISPKMFKMLGQMSLSLDDPEAQEYLEMVPASIISKCWFQVINKLVVTC